MRSPTADATTELAAGPEPVLPTLVLAAYLACVAGAAALANCALVAALLKRSTNGLYSIMIQLAVADLALIATALGPELWSSNMKTWAFGIGSCTAHRGLSVFTSTASLYLVTTIALHTIATVNLETKATIQRNKRCDREDDDEIGSSRHSLVASSDTSTPPRTMNVDYRIVDYTVVPIAPPSIFVWVLSASLSIPEFALATTVRLDQDTVICTLVDSSHNVQMQSLLSVFNFILPTLIMVTASILIILRLTSKKLRSQIEGSESVAALKLSLSLIFVYGLLCTPRSLIHVYSIYSTAISGKNYAIKDNVIQLISLACSAAFLAAALMRPLLCIFSIPQLRKIFIFGFKKSDVNDV